MENKDLKNKINGLYNSEKSETQKLADEINENLDNEQWWEEDEE